MTLRELYWELRNQQERLGKKGEQATAMKAACDRGMKAACDQAMKALWILAESNFWLRYHAEK